MKDLYIVIKAFGERFTKNYLIRLIILFHFLINMSAEVKILILT